MASAQSLSSVNSDPWHILRGIILGYQRASTGSLVPAAVEAMMLKRSIFLGTTWMNHQHRSTGDLLMLGKPECRGINHSIFSCPDNIDSGFPQTDPFLSAVYTKIIRWIISTLQRLVLWRTFGISIKSNHQLDSNGNFKQNY